MHTNDEHLQILCCHILHIYKPTGSFNHRGKENVLSAGLQLDTWNRTNSQCTVNSATCPCRERENLNTASFSSKTDLLLDRIHTESAVLTEPSAGPSLLNFPCGAHPCCRMATEDLSTISKQLHSQAQVIESLTQSVQRLKQEKEIQQQNISLLEEQVNRLQQNPHGALEAVLGLRMEGLKTELRSLRQHVFQQSDGDCTPDLFSRQGIIQDMLESKKVLWQEYEFIRRDVEQLKHKLEQQQEDLLTQVSATHEIKRTQTRYCKMLEDLVHTHKAQTYDLEKARVETESTQQDLNHVKSAISNLNKQVKTLHLEDKLHTLLLKEERTRPKKKKELLCQDALVTLSDDSFSELSLTDVSSEELFSEPEVEQLTEDKISTSSLELENPPGGATGGTQEKAELGSEESASLPELNVSDL